MSTGHSIRRHINPPNNPPDQPIARAPYNFVPLPQAIFEVASVELADSGDGNAPKLKPDARFVFAVNADQARPIWECHDHFVKGTHSGWIDLSIEALTPVFIRGPVTQRPDETWDTRYSRLRSAPFLDHQGRPTIPGSSLRGLLRNLVEILSYSKIQPVSNKRPFFRTMTKSRISDAYREWFIEDLGQLTSGIDIATLQPVRKSVGGHAATVRAGIVRIDGHIRRIEECGFGRVEHQQLRKAFGTRAFVGARPNETPNPAIQHQSVVVTADPQPLDYFFERKISRNGRERHPDLYLRFRRIKTIARPTDSQTANAVVVISGNMQHKHLEFVFLTGEAHGVVNIPSELWERFHDDDQISQWQERSFPKGSPKSRGTKGHLRDGEPVFFVCDESKASDDNPQGLVFFGRAQMFRFPYDRTPAELVPAHLRSVEQRDDSQTLETPEIELGTAGLDLAEAIFGRVKTRSRQGVADPLPTIKGRVFCEDCTVTAGGEWREQEIVPQILGSPKVTAYQQYLTQDGEQGDRQHTTYIAGDKTTIRGQKIYWHRWEESGTLEQVHYKPQRPNDPAYDVVLADLQADARAIDLHENDRRHSQHTLAQPVRSGVTFTGRVRFENLTDIELGALLAALNLPQDCAHKIGMAKPLGLGSVRITATLHRIDRAARYSDWNSLGTSNSADQSQFLAAFTTAIVQHGKAHSEATIKSHPESSLSHLARLDALFTLLRWDPQPAPDGTRYLTLEEFKHRPVLQTPHRIVDAAEPNWPGLAPEPHAIREQAIPNRKGQSTSAETLAVPQAVPKPPAKHGKFTEKVTLEKRLNSGKARIKLESGQTIECSAINAGTPIADDNTFIAEIEWINGEPMRAKFKRKT